MIQDILRDGQTVQERVTIQKGTRPWRQADLKLFLFGDENMRYGIKFSFYSGSLPPSFAKTRALQVGIVIQSNDEKTAGAPVSKQ